MHHRRRRTLSDSEKSSSDLSSDYIPEQAYTTNNLEKHGRKNQTADDDPPIHTYAPVGEKNRQNHRHRHHRHHTLENSSLKAKRKNFQDSDQNNSDSNEKSQKNSDSQLIETLKRQISSLSELCDSYAKLIEKHTSANSSLRRSLPEMKSKKEEILNNHKTLEPTRVADVQLADYC